MKSKCPKPEVLSEVACVNQQKAWWHLGQMKPINALVALILLTASAAALFGPSTTNNHL